MISYPDDTDAVLLQSVHSVLRQNGFQWIIADWCGGANGSKDIPDKNI